MKNLTKQMRFKNFYLMFLYSSKIIKLYSEKKKFFLIILFIFYLFYNIINNKNNNSNHIK